MQDRLARLICRGYGKFMKRTMIVTQAVFEAFRHSSTITENH